MMRTKILIAVAAVAALALAIWFWNSRTSSDAAEEDPHPGKVAGLTVAVARVQRGDLGDTLTLAGAFKPFQDVQVHAKVAGYIRRINVDVGDRVKEGQVLAVLEIPELTAQLAGAEASVRAAQEQIRREQGDLQRAQSNHSALHSAYARLKQAADSREGLVAQQELDDSHAKDLESEGQVASTEAALSAAKEQLEVAEATQKQVSALSDYMHITAPFAGVVTSRTADTGSLVAAGTTESTQAIPVVHLAQTSVLRLVLPVPESIAAGIRVGQTMSVHVQALNKDFPGKVARFADSLNEQTRTMETEIDLDNRDNKVIPGMYAEVVVPLDQQHAALNIPLEAVMHDSDGPTVWVVNAQNKVELRRITVGYQGSTRVVVPSGLQEGERVIVGAQSGLTAGQTVGTKDVTVVAPAAAPATSPAKAPANDSKGAQ
jgi:RND family efflux transporter MFP subunit